MFRCADVQARDGRELSALVLICRVDIWCVGLVVGSDLVEVRSFSLGQADRVADSRSAERRRAVALDRDAVNGRRRHCRERRYWWRPSRRLGNASRQLSGL